MDRETCRTNLKKLKLPGVKSTGKHKGKLTVNAAISNYFQTPKVSECKLFIKKDELKVNSSQSPSTMINHVDLRDELNTQNSSTIIKPFGSLQKDTQVVNNRKHTKLKDFVFNKGENITSNDKHDSFIIKNSQDRKQCIETPLKKPTKLQKARSSKGKSSRSNIHQTDIKSSLMRSERIFSEITGHHCRLDNFSADEIELALALSKSEIETSGIQSNDDDKQYAVKQHSEDEKLNDIKTVLENYGFRTFLEGYNNSTPSFCSNRRGKAKWARRFTDLTLRDSTLQRNIVNSKIDYLMSKQLGRKLLCPGMDQIATYPLISSNLRNLKAPNNLLTSLEREEQTDLEYFFVRSLFEVSPVKSGYLLKDWHAIQGRDKSPQCDKHCQNKDMEVSKQMDSTLLKVYVTKTPKPKLLHQIQLLESERPIKNKETRELHKDVTLDKTSVGSPTIVIDLKESFSVIEENPKKCYKNASLVNEFGDAKIAANSCKQVDQSIDLESLTKNIVFDCNKEILSSCKVNMVSIRSQSPNIFAVSEDELEDAASKIVPLNDHHKKIYTNVEDDLENIQNPIISHVNGLIQNVSVEKSNMNKDKYSIFFGEEFDHKKTCENLNTLSANTKTWSISNENIKNFKYMNSIRHEIKEDLIDSRRLPSDNGISYSTAKADMTERKKMQTETIPSIGNQTFQKSMTIMQSKSKLFSTTDINSTNNQPCIFASNEIEWLTSNRMQSAFADISNGEKKCAESNNYFEDCVILSDDEINYSILKADMGRNKIQSKSYEANSETKSIQNVAMNDCLIIDLMKHESFLTNYTDKSPDTNITFTRKELKAPHTPKSSFSTELMELGILCDMPEPLTQTSSVIGDTSLFKGEQSVSMKNKNFPFGFENLLKGCIHFNNTPEMIGATEMVPTHLDSSLLCDFSPHEYEVDGRNYVTRIVTEPKPIFSRQSESEILKQLYGFGIKPLKRKQAVKMLEYIYNYTYPMIYEQTNCANIITKDINSSPIDTEFGNNISQAWSHVPLLPNKLQLTDYLGTITLRFTKELQTDLEHENYIFQTNVTKKQTELSNSSTNISQQKLIKVGYPRDAYADIKKLYIIESRINRRLFGNNFEYTLTPRPLLPLHIAWYNLLSSSTVLHEKILMYKPIDLHEIYTFFKEIGYRFDPKDIKMFLDYRCIIFRYDITQNGRQSERHGKLKNKN